MLPVHQKQVHAFGLFGSESLGKTTIGYLVTGRLRTHGYLAEFVTDSSAAMPFSPAEFDKNPLAWYYVWTRKVMKECEYALRANVDMIVSDRTPFDLWLYMQFKSYWHEGLPNRFLREALENFSLEWLKYYDLLFWLPSEGTTYRYDKFREETEESRNAVEEMIRDKLSLLTKLPSFVEANGSYRERSEFIYHRILSKLTGKTKPLDVLEKVSRVARANLVGVKEIYFEGSHSVHRFHVPKETDDFDIVIVVEQENRLLLQTQQIIDGMKDWLEKVCEATLDIKVVNEAMKPYEV